MNDQPLVSAVGDSGDQSGPLLWDWRESVWAANVWLLFLLFPLFSVLLSDLEMWQKVLGVALIALFAMVHVVSYRAMALREIAEDSLSTLQPPRHIGPTSPWFFFWILVGITAVGVTVIGPGLLGCLPFIVVFGIFNFRWSIAMAILAGCVIACVVVPIAFDLFPELLFFVVIVVSTGAGASFTRMAEQTSAERAELRTDLAVADERNRVARDVHDVLGHSLTAVILKTQVCDRLLAGLEPGNDDDRATIAKARAELSELDTVSRRAMAEIRSTVGGLRVANLSDEIAAARAVLADAGVNLSVTASAESMERDHEKLMAWVVRESVTNIVRHARADNCVIEFPPDPATLIRIADDGIGVRARSNGDAARGFEGNGIRGMRERVEAAGAELVIAPGPADAGTTIEVRV